MRRQINWYFLSLPPSTTVTPTSSPRPGRLLLNGFIFWRIGLRKAEKMPLIAGNSDQSQGNTNASDFIISVFLPFQDFFYFFLSEEIFSWNGVYPSIQDVDWSIGAIWFLLPLFFFCCCSSRRSAWLHSFVADSHRSTLLSSEVESI